MKSIARLRRYRLEAVTNRERNGAQRRKRVVVVTGCDSGLGYSLSRKCDELGFSVVSGCLDANSEGAALLSSTTLVHSVDVRSRESVRELRERANAFIEKENGVLHAVVNNAGVMVFGEFEWLTERQVLEHVHVNMLGSFRVAKEFLPLLRKHKGRLINITSHCAVANLPSLSVYGATKAAVQSWSDGLRVEQAKYGVKVITFIPGSLAAQSNIMSRQGRHAKEMEDEFTPEQRAFYGDYFKSFNSYLVGLVSGPRKPLRPVQDDALYRKFVDCLTNPNPRSHYKREPFRYFLYYNLFRWTPTRVRDRLVRKFMKFPSYDGENR